MCGRVRLSSDVSEIKLVSIPPHRPTPNTAPSWNVAPTDPMPVIRYDAKAGERSLDVLRWGLVPFWAKALNVGFQLYPIQPPRLRGGGRGCARSCLPRRIALPARQCSGDLAYRLLMLLVPDFGKVARDLELHTLVRHDLPRTFFPDTFVKIGDRRAQRAGDLK